MNRPRWHSVNVGCIHQISRFVMNEGEIDGLEYGCRRGNLLITDEEKEKGMQYAVRKHKCKDSQRCYIRRKTQEEMDREDREHAKKVMTIKVEEKK